MKNILMGVVALTIGCAMFALLPAQEPGGRGGAKTKTGGPGIATAVAGTPVLGAPFSAVAVTEVTQTLGDGNRIVNNQSQKIYRDGQGRERQEAGDNVQISDPVAGTSYRLNAQTRTATQTPLMLLPQRIAAPGQGADAAIAQAAALAAQMAALQAQLAAQSAQAKSSPAAATTRVREDLGTQNMEGVFATGTRSTQTIPAGQLGNERPISVVEEVWYSPDLQMNVMTKHSDPRAGDNVYRITQIIRAEPDPRLFQVPSDYTVSTGGGRGGGRSGPVAVTSTTPGIAKVSPAVMASKIVTKVDPQYTDQALKAKWQGTVVLNVTIDQAGVPGDITVAGPLGMGLDEKAIAAVQQWRFSPTLLNNVPVKVQTQVEVTFKLP